MSESGYKFKWGEKYGSDFRICICNGFCFIWIMVGELIWKIWFCLFLGVRFFWEVCFGFWILRESCKWLILGIFGFCLDYWCLRYWFGKLVEITLIWIISTSRTRNIISSHSTRTLLKNLVTTITHTLTLTTQTSHQLTAALTALVCALKRTTLLTGP